MGILSPPGLLPPQCQGRRGSRLSWCSAVELDYGIFLFFSLQDLCGCTVNVPTIDGSDPAALQ